MDAPIKGRGWRRCRAAFRAFRIGVLVLVLVLVAAGAYLNEVGLPDFLKRPLLADLRARGVDLQFSRLRLRWHRGVVAEDVRFGSAAQESNAPSSPSLKEAQVKLDHESLARFRFRIDALILEDGRLWWPVPETNGPPRGLEATNIQAQLRFLTNDQWELDHFTASFAGARVELSGSVTNASRLRDWKIFQPRPAAGARPLAGATAATGEHAGPAQLFRATEAGGPFWRRRARSGKFWRVAHGASTGRRDAVGNVHARRTDGAAHATRRGDEPTPGGSGVARGRSRPAGRTRARPGGARACVAAGESDERDSGPSGRVGGGIHDEMGAGVRRGLAGGMDPRADQLDAAVRIGGAATDQCADGAGKRRDARTERAPNPPEAAGPPATDERWSWWADLAPYSLDWNCNLKDVHAEDPHAGAFEFKALACGGYWRAPELTLTNAHAELYRGKFDAHARLNVVSREATFAGAADFDVQKVAPLLSEGARQWLGQYSWEIPPLVHATGGVVLPDWTNAQPDWRGEVRPTLWLQGDAAAGNAAFRGVAVSSASLHFNYSNMLWTVPDLVAERPEGRLLLSDEADDRTQQFHFHIRSTVDPKALRDQLPPQGQPGLDAFIFTQPPVIKADVWGKWHEPGLIGVKAHVIMTNFALRGESATRFEGDVQYTNQYVILTDGRIDCGERFMTASGLGVDLEARRAYLTNGFSTMVPAAFFHVVSPKIARVMEPYQFAEAAHGTCVRGDSAGGGRGAGPAFSGGRRAVPLDAVQPGPHFRRRGLGGQAPELHECGGRILPGPDAGGSGVRLHGGSRADLKFRIAVEDASLRALMADVSSKTNRMEGLLTGNLNITSANTESFTNWSGNGRLDLRDGVLWEIPIFGIFSQALDKVSPGLGESRAKHGSATFTIVNSVIYSDNLEIQAPALEMLYRGKVDFKGRVDATVEAQLFKELPLGLGTVVGLAVKPLTWLFEYKVTGTLADPKSEPQFPITRIPLFILNPMQSLRDLARP